MGRCRTADIAAAVAESGHEVMPGWAQTLARVTDAERFPALHAALASEAFEQDDEFVWGLARILDGVAALIAERR
jgi:tetracycline repressor-like protein